MNVVATMLLGGLWHGANWTFVAWGGLHGAALAVNHVWQGRGFRLPRVVAWALTLLFVMACWVLFRSAEFATAGDVLASMVGMHGLGRITLDREYVVALIGGAAIALLGPDQPGGGAGEAAAEGVARHAGRCRAGVSAAAGRRPVAECLHLLPVLTPSRLGAASSASRPARRVLAVVVIYAFVVLVDPFDTLPLSPPADRVPVATNARFAFPSLARSDRFDSAIFGTSTSRLLRPVVLNAEFGARFANLSMNAATAYEQSRLMAVFRTAHPAARVVMVGARYQLLRRRRDAAEIHAASVPGVDVRRQPVAWLRRDVQPLCGAGGRPGVRHPDRHQAPGLRQRRLHQLRAAGQRLRSARGLRMHLRDDQKFILPGGQRRSCELALSVARSPGRGSVGAAGEHAKDPVLRAVQSEDDAGGRITRCVGVARMQTARD